MNQNFKLFSKGFFSNAITYYRSTMKVFLLLVSLINSQVIIIKDGQSNEPLQDVNLFSKSTGTTTDKNGFCNLDKFLNNEQIHVTMIGYEEVLINKNNFPKILLLEPIYLEMEEVSIVGQKKWKRKRYSRLERNVRKVYPYAITLSNLLKKYDFLLDSLEAYSGLNRYLKKREIFSKIEEDLIDKYGNSITKLTKSQGRILIRLVDRETSKTSFDIIKNFRNIFSAGFWQITARIFGHNLKASYDPTSGEDKQIEYIIKRKILKKRNNVLRY